MSDLWEIASRSIISVGFLGRQAFLFLQVLLGLYGTIVTRWGIQHTFPKNPVDVVFTGVALLQKRRLLLKAKDHDKLKG